MLFSKLCSNTLPSWQRSKALKARQNLLSCLCTKTSTEIRRDFSGEESQVKKNTVILGNVPVPGDTVGFEKLLIYLVCFVSHRGLHVMLQFCLLRLRLYHSLLLLSAWQYLWEPGLGCVLGPQNGVPGKTLFREKLCPALHPCSSIS